MRAHLLEHSSDISKYGSIKQTAHKHEDDAEYLLRVGVSCDVSEPNRGHTAHCEVERGDITCENNGRVERGGTVPSSSVFTYKIPRVKASVFFQSVGPILQVSIVI